MLTRLTGVCLALMPLAVVGIDMAGFACPEESERDAIWKAAGSGQSKATGDKAALDEKLNQFCGNGEDNSAHSTYGRVHTRVTASITKQCLSYCAACESGVCTLAGTGDKSYSSTTDPSKTKLCFYSDANVQTGYSFQVAGSCSDDDTSSASSLYWPTVAFLVAVVSALIVTDCARAA
eukprot:TRINITY_DN14269_c0_g1_i3.p1 TRINITY_DN14269_c0_g1~~TRINITY_DN14269_c0_g1_i3.p1  ORF type:complete len:178 (-),score=20.93 TRINITY_DN14269_c0_g1_i3:194-727(-)